MEKLYCDRAGGLARYDAWVYVEGRRHYIFTRVSLGRIEDYAKRWRYRVVVARVVV